jgi:hypothetical protein
MYEEAVQKDEMVDRNFTSFKQQTYISSRAAVANLIHLEGQI